MKEKFKAFVKRSILEGLEERASPNNIESAFQYQLTLQHKALMEAGSSVISFRDAGYQVYSQNDEDGKLQFIFAAIGTVNKLCVDIAFASPVGANTTNLIVNHGWHAFLVDGADMQRSAQFFSSNIKTCVYPPVTKREWVTAENINDMLDEAGWKGEVDLLSLDVDGVDYWLWKALGVISPRVVVVEYQDFLGPEKVLTVPYDPEFSRYNHHEDFYGASLGAFVKLAKEKDYRLVGTNNLQYNAFFVRNDITSPYLPEIEMASCFTHPKVKEGMASRYNAVKDLQWVEV